jgi:5'-3' exonuclease
MENNMVALEPKLIVLDFSEIFFTSVFGHRRIVQSGTKMTLEFLVLRKIFSYIRPFPNRRVCLIADGVASWRKDVYPEYKGQRKQQRDSFEDLDWPIIFEKYSLMLSRFELYTNAYTYRDDKLEADDIIAVMVAGGQDIIVFSSDKDLNQLCIHNNLTLYSPKTKKVKNKFVPKVITNPILELEKLVKGGDRCDNIPSAKTEVQRIINNKLVNLLQLPPIIEDRIRLVINQRREKSQQDIEAFHSFYPYAFVPKELGNIPYL